MMFKIEQLFVFVLAILAMYVNATRGFDVKQNKEDKYDIIKIENKFISVTFTSMGGRIKSFINKQAKNKEIVLWAPGEGGWLDDRGSRTMAAYEYNLVSKNKDKIVFEYTYLDSSNFHWTKRITIFDNSPAVTVEYIITNKATHTQEYEHMIRNFIKPTKGLYCCYNNEQGVQRVKWASWCDKSKSIWERKIAAPWLGIVNELENWGLGIGCNRLGIVYFWVGNGRGTVEWVYPKISLKANESVRFTATLIPIVNMENISYACDNGVLGFSYLEKVKLFTFENQFYAVKSDGKITIKSILMNMHRKKLAELSVNIKSEIGKPINKEYKWQAPADGMYIISQQILVKDKKVGEYETPIVAGFLGDNAPIYIHPKFKPKAPRWTFDLTSDDIKRGYFICLPTEKRKREAMENISVDLVRNEYEFVDLRLECLQIIGKVNFTLDKGDFTGDAAVLVDNRKDWLYSNKPMHAMRGAKNAFGIKLSTFNVLPGEYNLTLKIVPERSKPTNLTIHVKVWDYKLPARDDLYMSFFWSSFGCVFDTLYPNVKDTEKQLKLYRLCLGDMQMMGQNIFEIRNRRDILKKFIKVKQFGKSGIPILDFSGWNVILNEALKRGMNNAVFRYGWPVSNSWLPENFKKLPKDKQKQIRLAILKQEVKYLKSKGFKRVFWYLIDELDPSPEKVQSVCNIMDEAKKIVPELEFAGSGFASTPFGAMQKLAKRLTWIAPYWSVYSVVDWMQSGKLKMIEGTIPATQLDGEHKTGYVKHRIGFWQGWKGHLKGFQIYGYHTYYPNHGYSCVYPGKDGPVPAASMFGLIDGWEDFCLLWALRDKLKSKGLLEAENLLVGDNDKSILKWVWRSGGSFTYPVVIGEDKQIRIARKKLLKLLTE